MSVLVLGYYDRSNLGDEMYKTVFPLIFPNNTIDFHNIENIHDLDINRYKSIIVGGGDLINEYFLKKLRYLKDIKSIPIIAYSIGFPFESCITPENISLFDRIFTRNIQELELLQLLIGSDRAHYLPDAGFKLTVPLNIKPVKKIGVFLAQSLYKYHKQSKIVDNFVNLLLSIPKSYKIVFYTFDTSDNEKQDDRIISKVISSKLNKNINLISESNVNKMLESMKDLELAICIRFHSHIFCTLLGIPFISITETSKVEKYLKQEGLYDLHVPIHSVTHEFDVHLALQKIRLAYTYKNKLIEIRNNNRFLLDGPQAQILLNNTSKNTYVIPRYLQLDAKNLYSQLNIHDSPENIAQKMSYLVNKDPNSEYVYGTINNIIEKGLHAIPDMLHWMISDYKNKQNIKKRINIEYMNQNLDIDIHRSGWNYVINHLKSICNNTGIILDLYLDKTFGWSKKFLSSEGVIPYTSPWIGFVHHTFNTEFSENNNEIMINCEEFRRSLPTCRGIFVLSDFLKRLWMDKLSGIKIFNLTHPTEFNFIPFKLKWSYNLVSVGAWYRNPITFYRLDTGDIQKIALKGKHMDNYFPPKNIIITKDMLLEHYKYYSSEEAMTYGTGLESDCSCMCRLNNSRNIWMNYLLKYILKTVSTEELIILLNIKDKEIVNLNVSCYQNLYQNAILQFIKKILKSVEIREKVDNLQYDEILSSNVVFIHLIDASASNTLIECIVRNTPIIVNPLPAVMELLGKNYPLYFDGDKNIHKLLKKGNVEKAYLYLKSLDKDKFRIETFVKKFSEYIDQI